MKQADNSKSTISTVLFTKANVNAVTSTVIVDPRPREHVGHRRTKPKRPLPLEMTLRKIVIRSKTASSVVEVSRMPMMSFICRFSFLFLVHSSCLLFRSQMVDAFFALQVSLSGGIFKREV